MKILMRKNKNEKWQLVQSADYKAEEELQIMLEEEPSLIALDEIREGAGALVLALREFPLEIGSIDLLGFTADGDIVAIECKLAANEEIKRKVIAQVFEYGAYLWGLRYEDIDLIINQKHGKGLADLIREATTDPGWNEEAFRLNVEKALQNGDIILMIVVNEINEELNRIIRFINYAGKPAFSLSALEIRRFQNGPAEMLVPHVFGVVRASIHDGNQSRRKKWEKKSFFDDAQNRIGQQEVAILNNLYEWSRENSGSVRFGTGPASGSFTFYYEKQGKSGSIFSVFTNGLLTLNFQYMEKIYSPDQILEFRSRLSRIPTFKDLSSSRPYFFTIKLAEAFSKDEYLADFKREVLLLRK